MLSTENNSHTTINNTANRKLEHIDICTTQNVESHATNAFEKIILTHHSLPDINYSELNTRVDFLGTEFDFPLMITGMTGGVVEGEQINESLAYAAQKLNIPMGVGSQRLNLESSSIESNKLKQKFNNLFLIGNLGIGQFYSLDEKQSLKLIDKAVASINADAIAIHLNVIQELIQPEGNREFKGLLTKLHYIIEHSKTPIIIKEVGHGLCINVLSSLAATKVAAIDIAGNGGTSWGYIEGLRKKKIVNKDIGETFRAFGTPTAIALANAQLIHPFTPLIASGGVRTGLEVAKSIALGARLAAIGLPLLKAAMISKEAVIVKLEKIITELKISMLCTNSKSLENLSSKIMISKQFSTEQKLYQR